MLPMHFHRLLGLFCKVIRLFQRLFNFFDRLPRLFLGWLGFFNMPRPFHWLLEFFLGYLPYFRGPLDLFHRMHGFFNRLSKLTLRFLGFFIAFIGIFLGLCLGDSIGCLGVPRLHFAIKRCGLFPPRLHKGFPFSKGLWT
jgi:hypothetical protein